VMLDRIGDSLDRILATVTAERDGLRGLVNFAEHSRFCAWLSTAEGECDCGYDDAARAAVEVGDE